MSERIFKSFGTERINSTSSLLWVKLDNAWQKAGIITVTAAGRQVLNCADGRVIRGGSTREVAEEAQK